ncbi:MAG: hypothetical protein C0614_10415 [Desulfuromonas sp.]|nr:MAG: hypothetical protein C0614_10415 [Desulfuromonas sp.]
MGFSEFEIKRLEKLTREFINHLRPPVDVRDKVDLGCRIEGQSVYLYEIRARWDQPEVKLESAIAKATFVRSKKVWKISWKRADLRWHKYQPCPEVNSIERFLEVVDEDSFGCFWG